MFFPLVNNVIVAQRSDIGKPGLLLSEVPGIIIRNRGHALNRNAILKIKINHGLDLVEILLIARVCDHGIILT
jgi:hypothetical protein